MNVDECTLMFLNVLSRSVR